jgi:hypothetical protein
VRDWRLPRSAYDATIVRVDAVRDPLIHRLDALIQARAVAARLGKIVRRVGRQLAATDGPMAWEVVPLTMFVGLPESVRSCWIFVIRAGASTGAERHPNSHQRSCSWLGGGTFEVYDGAAWRSHALSSQRRDELGQRWVSIPASRWHRLRVGPADWGIVSFHTVGADDLIEENPLAPDHLEGPTRQERYAGRR